MVVPTATNCRAMSEYRSLEEPRDVSQRVLCATPRLMTTQTLLVVHITAPKSGSFPKLPPLRRFTVVCLCFQAVRGQSKKLVLG